MNLVDQGSRNLGRCLSGVDDRSHPWFLLNSFFFLPDSYPLTIPTVKSAFIYMSDRPFDNAVKLACLSPHNVAN